MLVLTVLAYFGPNGGKKKLISTRVVGFAATSKLEYKLGSDQLDTFDNRN